MSNRVAIVDVVRTGLAKSVRGKLNLARADDLAAHCVNALIDRNSHIRADEVEDLVLGVGRQVGEQSANLARHVSVLSKLPIEVPGTTISRACASGLNAIAVAANQIASGFGKVIMAGGVESITGLLRGDPGRFAENPRLLDQHPEVFIEMGKTAEIVAHRYGVSREEQDQYALQSQQRYHHAVVSGFVAEEIVPMEVHWQSVAEQDEVAVGVLDKDECNRPDTTIQKLSELKPAFQEGGTVTAGNSSQLADGASIALLVSDDVVARLGLVPLGYFRGFVATGCEPDEMGIGPVSAVPGLLDYAGLSMNEIDLFELNEAFASQTVYCRHKLGIDPDRFNVNGGSIAIGHPFGMTGARLTGALLRELRRRRRSLGIVTMCIGKGMGAAALFEACW